MDKQKKLPRYELKINVEADAMVSAISLVESPAIESNFLAFNKDYLYQQFAANEERMELIGAAMIPDQIIYRFDKSTKEEFEVFFTTQTIREIAMQYMKHGFQSNMNINHSSTPAKSYVFQSYLTDSEKGISAPKGIDVPNGTWVVGVKVDDKDVWNDIKAGKTKGFSIEGLFDWEQSFSKDDNDEADLIDILNQLNEANNIIKQMMQNDSDKSKK